MRGTIPDACTAAPIVSRPKMVWKGQSTPAQDVPCAHPPIAAVDTRLEAQYT